MTASNIRQYLIRPLMLAVLVQPAAAAGLFQGLTSVEAGPRLDDDGVIRQQVWTAIPLWGCNVAIIYLAGFWLWN